MESTQISLEEARNLFGRIATELVHDYDARVSRPLKSGLELWEESEKTITQSRLFIERFKTMMIITAIFASFLIVMGFISGLELVNFVSAGICINGLLIGIGLTHVYSVTESSRLAKHEIEEMRKVFLQLREDIRNLGLPEGSEISSENILDQAQDLAIQALLIQSELDVARPDPDVNPLAIHNISVKVEAINHRLRLFKGTARGRFVICLDLHSIFNKANGAITQFNLLTTEEKRSE